MRRLSISTQPISMTRSPSFTFSPVVSVSRTICRITKIPLRRYASIGKTVGALVLRMAGVALHPVPLDVVLLPQLVQLDPQVLVLHVLLVGGLPAVALPAV